MHSHRYAAPKPTLAGEMTAMRGMELEYIMNLDNDRVAAILVIRLTSGGQRLGSRSPE